jgi:xanthine dehydrogenase accessory factor
MTRLFGEMARLLDKGESFAVTTILDKTGSAPRTAGAKMIVRRDGSIIGTIGGGRLEARAIVLAMEGCASRRTQLHAFDLTGEDAAGMDMICGGKGELLIDFIDAADEDSRNVYREAAEALERRDKAWLVTAIGTGPGASSPSRQQCLVRRDGTLVGRLDVDPAFLAKLKAGPAKISIHADVLEGQRVLVEPIRRQGTVFIFGAGHVSQRIAPLSETVGFRTVVLDDRAEYASRSRFPEPIELVVVQSLDALPEVGVDEDGYVVIVTRGHLHDGAVLEQALLTRAAYIGMIGSRRKRDTVYEALASRGHDRQKLARVHSPIGTEILAETPEEIAVSIVGELIKVRAERERRA